MASPAAAPQTPTRSRGRRGGRLSFIKQRRSITERLPMLKAAIRRAIGKPTSCCSPIWPRLARPPRTTHPLQPGRSSARSKGRPHGPDHRPAARSASPGNAQTISFDNGTEFAEHYTLHKTLDVQTFFCDPHSPWQKGEVENAIGRLRRSLPRKTDLSSRPAVSSNTSTASTTPLENARLQDTREVF